jgi:hypothetical protein
VATKRTKKSSTSPLGHEESATSRVGGRTYAPAPGPGLVTGASDDEPSGIATYAQAGAKFGFSMLRVTVWHRRDGGMMGLRIALATTVDADPSKVYDVVRTTEGQKAFWTSDCDLDDHHGRFGFAEASVDLNVAISLVANELARMKVESGFPGWNGSTWEWALSSHHDSPNQTNVQFRHFDFESGYGEPDVAYAAQSWAMILDRLARYLKSGVPDPFFANHAA